MRKSLTAIILFAALAAHAETASTYFPNIEVKKLKFLGATELTIATGAVTVTQTYHTLDGEGDASDTLTTITGGSAGQQAYFTPANAARDITLEHGTGNIITGSGNDYTIPDNGIVLMVCDGTNWRVITAGVTTTYTAQRVLISDSLGVPSASTVTDTTLQYLDATSSVQTQINGKEATITTLPVNKGGTGQATAQAAIDALVPSQAAAAGKYLGSDGPNTMGPTGPKPLNHPHSQQQSRALSTWVYRMHTDPVPGTAPIMDISGSTSMRRPDSMMQLLMLQQATSKLHTSLAREPGQQIAMGVTRLQTITL